MKRVVWYGILSNRSLKLVTEGPAIIILMLLDNSTRSSSQDSIGSYKNPLQFVLRCFISKSVCQMQLQRKIMT